jgi:hypothetical protein
VGRSVLPIGELFLAMVMSEQLLFNLEMLVQYLPTKFCSN